MTRAGPPRAGKLADKGLVTREADPSDARSVMCCLTPDGKALVDRVMSRREQLYADAF
jgi:DNA-binding MarR family transcriptional regulator